MIVKLPQTQRRIKMFDTTAVNVKIFLFPLMTGKKKARVFVTNNNFSGQTRQDLNVPHSNGRLLISLTDQPCLKEFPRVLKLIFMFENILQL